MDSIDAALLMLWPPSLGLIVQERAPHVSTFCLPGVTTYDQISQEFPSVFTYYKRSNTGGGNGLGTRLRSRCNVNGTGYMPCLL